MKLVNGAAPMVVNTLEDMVKLHNINLEITARHLIKLSKKNKRATLLSLLALGGTLYLAKKEKQTADKLDRLEESHKDLLDDYHHYRISHAEYDPDKDEDYDI